MSAFKRFKKFFRPDLGHANIELSSVFRILRLAFPSGNRSKRKIAAHFPRMGKDRNMGCDQAGPTLIMTADMLQFIDAHFLHGWQFIISITDCQAFLVLQVCQSTNLEKGRITSDKTMFPFFFLDWRGFRSIHPKGTEIDGDSVGGMERNRIPAFSLRGSGRFWVPPDSCPSAALRE